MSEAEGLVAVAPPSAAEATTAPPEGFHFTESNTEAVAPNVPPAPPEDKPEPQADHDADSDVAFALRLLKVDPKLFITDGVFNRSSFQAYVLLRGQGIGRRLISGD